MDPQIMAMLVTALWPRMILLGLTDVRPKRKRRRRSKAARVTAAPTTVTPTRA